MCLYFLIKAFLYNYYKNRGQLMKFMLSKTYKNGFWTREISNKSTKKCRWENTTVTTVTSSFKTLISPENAIFKASNTFEPRLFGTILSMVSTPTPPPPPLFSFSNNIYKIRLNLQYHTLSGLCFLDCRDKSNLPRWISKGGLQPLRQNSTFLFWGKLSVMLFFIFILLN